MESKPMDIIVVEPRGISWIIFHEYYKLINKQWTAKQRTLRGPKTQTREEANRSAMKLAVKKGILSMPVFRQQDKG